MIAFFSPKVINWISAVVSILLESVKDKDSRKELVLKMHHRFKKIPQTGLIDIWLQRISAPLEIDIDYSDNLTKVAVGKMKNSELWECAWLKDEIKNLIDLVPVSTLSQKLKDKVLSPVIQKSEVELFKKGYF